MAREKPPEAGVPEWILTYGDMMSLLLCFFIMLFSMSTLQVVKVQAAIESLREGFGYTGASLTPKGKANASKPRINSAARARRSETLAGGQPIQAPKGDNRTVQNIRVDEEDVRDGLIRFEAGSDELTDRAKEELQLIYDQLVGSPYKIQIAGYTTPGEQGGLLRTEMDLAYTRATNVRDYLIKTFKFKPSFFQISVPGPYEPISRNVVPPGVDPRSANSAVVVRLLSNTVREMETDKSERNLRLLEDAPVQ